MVDTHNAWRKALSTDVETVSAACGWDSESTENLRLQLHPWLIFLDTQDGWAVTSFHG